MAESQQKIRHFRRRPLCARFCRSKEISPATINHDKVWDCSDVVSLSLSLWLCVYTDASIVLATSTTTQPWWCRKPSTQLKHNRQFGDILREWLLHFWLRYLFEKLNLFLNNTYKMFKFIFSEKTTKIWHIVPVDWNFTLINFQLYLKVNTNQKEDFVIFVALS